MIKLDAAPLALTVVDLKSLTDKVSDDWLNFPVAQTNDHVIRVSVMSQDFHWHSHQNSDETFLVLEGELIIDLDDRSETLGPGQLMTVPKGVRHRTRAMARSVNVTFEHGATVSTGD